MLVLLLLYAVNENDTVQMPVEAQREEDMPQSIFDHLSTHMIRGPSLVAVVGPEAHTVKYTNFLKQALNPQARDNVRSFKSEREMMDYTRRSDYGSDNAPEIEGALILEDPVGPSYSYRIRVNMSSPALSHVNSKNMRIDNSVIGRNYDNMHSDEGIPFLALQTAADTVILDEVGAWKIDNRQNLVVNDVTMPIRASRSPVLGQVISLLGGTLFTVAYILVATHITSGIVEEKELKIREGMKMMGLKHSMLIASWTFTYIILIAIHSFIIAVTGSMTLFKSSSTFLLWLFFFFTGMAIFALSYVVSTFVNNVRLVTPAVLLSFSIMYATVYFPLRGNQTTDKTLACFSPTACLSFAIGTIRNLDLNEGGLSSKTIDIAIEGLTAGGAMAILALDFLVFMLLGYYLDLVLGGDFGVKLPFYFPCMPSYWCGSSKVSEDGGDFVAPEDESEDAPHLQDPGARIEPIHTVPGGEQPLRQVRLRRLRKVFQPPVGTGGAPFVAVRNLSLDMVEGQIFVLLGHNGAGKTTTINMLTGMLEPTSGQAIMLGRNISGNPNALDALREQLGVCPQHDILYPNLSVQEHMELYAALKGVPKDQRQASIAQMIERVGLGSMGDNKLHALAGTLSGGQKRKLSVAIALLGGSRIVFLDEPSSGMDVNAQRAIWNLLLEERRNRVIVLTTHSMEEAELGDRIAIMSHGSLRCMGSSHFLKEANGVGYTLTITMERGVNDGSDESKAGEASAAASPRSGTRGNQRVIEFMRQHAPFAELVTDAGGEVAFRCAITDSAKFPEMFDKLDAHQADLGFATYGISVTTLTEVFLKVGEEMVVDDEIDDLGNFKSRVVTSSHASQKKSIQSNSLTEPMLGSDESKEISYQALQEVDDSGAAELEELFRKSYTIKDRTLRFFTHVRALYTKRFNYAKRDYRILFTQVVLPALILIPVFGLFRGLLSNSYPEETMTAGALGTTSFAYNPGTTPDLENIVNAFVAPMNKIRTIGDIKPVPIPGPNPFEDKLIETTFNSDPYRAFGIDIQSGANLPWTGLEPPAEGTVPELHVDLYWNRTARFGLVSAKNIFSNLLLNAYTGNNGPTPATIRIKNHPFDYKSNEVIYLSMSVALLLVIVLSMIPSTFAAFVVRERVEKAKHLQTISGVSGPAYWTANLLWDCTNFTLPLALVAILLQVYNLGTLGGSAVGAIALVLLFYPLSSSLLMYCVSTLFDSPTTAQSICTLINLGLSFILPIVTFVLNYFPNHKHWYYFAVFAGRLFPPYCVGDSILKISLSGLKSNDMIESFSDPYAMNTIGWNIIFLVIDVPIYIIVLYAIDHWTTTSSCMCFSRALSGEDRLDQQSLIAAPAQQQQIEDDDVAAERQRVESGQTQDDIVDLYSLRKVYHVRGQVVPHVAIKNLTYGIRRGECFGFLGANGAGKTTTIRILTGDEFPTSGTAKLGGYDILEHPYEVRQMIGYCPQFDALFDKLTAREHLFLYARLKGVPEDLLEPFANGLLQFLGLMPYADKLAGTFSGGNKRKLSVGIALVGNPAVVFLDEPSTGLDPAARRSMWQLISRTMSNRSVIVTTHSMEEAEALCTRIGIMVKGQLACLGSAAHLKRKYGHGYQIYVKAHPASIDAAKGFVMQFFPGCTVLEEHGQNLRFRVDRVGHAATIGGIFRLFESRPVEAGIQAYSVSETDLEQLFIRFVRNDVDVNNPN